MPVVLVGTLDTKGPELAFVRDLIRGAGLETIVIDAGSGGPPAFEPDIDRERVFFRAGTTSEELKSQGDRGLAVEASARGAASIVADLASQGRVEGIFALGGSAGTTIGTAAMRALRFGLPKVMVSTLASGQVRPFVGGSDLMMVHSVADIAGLNRLTRTVLTNAANALIGMVMKPSHDVIFINNDQDERPIIAATMFGVTTPCVDRARQGLEELGCDPLVFHATGIGGQAMEGLIRDGKIAGVLDLTTTELADELVGGVLSAGPDRLEAAGRRGIPQVVSVGALDMVNFGPMDTVPERFKGRSLHAHNPNVTLMRTTAEENARLGARIAEVLTRARGPTVVLIPRGGVSALDAPGRPFHDPGADAALFQALETGLAGSRVVLIFRDEHINDPAFADLAARTLLGLMSEVDPRVIDLDRLPRSWATPADHAPLEAFLTANGLATDGLAADLADVLLVRGRTGRLVGCAGLERHDRLGLLRSVAVASELRGYGLGTRLVAAVLTRAAADGVNEVVLLTRTAAEFFAKAFGFREVDRAPFEQILADSPGWALAHCASATCMSITMTPLESL
ncbi:MAG: GNAT family N-acetyltransferase [Isosphaeraceae bacterium]